MAQQTPLLSPVSGPSFAVNISRTTSKASIATPNNEEQHNDSHNSHLSPQQHHNLKYNNHKPIKTIMNRNYQQNRCHSTTCTRKQTCMNHLTLSVTPTSVSSSSASSCSASIHSNVSNLSSSTSKSPKSPTHPTHLLSKSHHILHAKQNQNHNHHYYTNTHSHRYYHSQSQSHVSQKRNPPKTLQPQPCTDNSHKCKSSIISRTVLQLIELGINAQTIRWPNITMQSHEYITILSNNKLKIIDTANKKILSNKHCNASSAMMNPQNNNNINNLQLLAMRDDNIIKVIHLNKENNNNDMVIEYKKDDHILFWRWLDSEIIAFITRTCVYHWIPTLSGSKSKCILSLAANRGPHAANDASICEANPFVQYINYDQSKDGNYLFVQGLTQSTVDGVDGVLTLYDINNNILQPQMNAFGACFADLDSFKNVTLFCYTKKEYLSAENECITKLYIVELYRYTKTQQTDDQSQSEGEFERKQIDACDGYKYHIRVERQVQFYHSNDFVVSMVQCRSVLYAVTKLGCLLIFDISSGICLYHQKVSRDVIFLVTPFPKANGIVALDRTGKLTLYYLNKSEFNDISQLHDKHLAILSYNVYNNSFAVKYKETYYESSFFLHQSNKDILLCVGHIKLVLVAALNVANIGYIVIRKYNMDGLTTQCLENNVILTQDLRFLKIELNENEIIDKQFNKILTFYNINYGISVEIIQQLLADNLFNCNCNELKVFTMNYLLKENNKLISSIKHLEKKVSFLTGQRLNNLSNDELLELEQNVNHSYLTIRNFIRAKFKCIVCYEKEKHILFKPCCHYVVCENCSDKLNKCPVCNTNISERIKVYQ